MTSAKRALQDAILEIGQIRSRDFSAAFAVAGLRHQTHNQLLKARNKLHQELKLGRVTAESLDAFESALITASFQTGAINKDSKSAHDHQAEIDTLLLKIDNVRDEINKE